LVVDNHSNPGTASLHYVILPAPQAAPKAAPPQSTTAPPVLAPAGSSHAASADLARITAPSLLRLRTVRRRGLAVRFVLAPSRHAASLALCGASRAGHLPRRAEIRQALRGAGPYRLVFTAAKLRRRLAAGSYVLALTPGKNVNRLSRAASVTVNLR